MPRQSVCNYKKLLTEDPFLPPWPFNRTDSNILVNLVDAFPHLRQIDLNVGPLFAPEHLEELVERERNRLERLSLRFNP